MTDKQIEKIIYENMPLLDIPDNISYDAVMAKIQDNSMQRSKTINIRRVVSIAASFLVIIIGLLSFASRLNEFKMADEYQAVSNDGEAYTPIPEPTPEEKNALFDEYNYSVTSDETHLVPENQTAEASAGAYIPPDEEVVLIIGTEREILIDSSFGKNAKICYYDLEGNLVDQDAIYSEIDTSENETFLVINAVKACNYTVAVEENNDIYRLNVVVLEE